MDSFTTGHEGNNNDSDLKHKKDDFSGGGKVTGTDGVKSKRTNRRSRRRRDATMPFDSLPIRLNSVSQIDVVARVVFPICFLVINYFYWNTYLGDEEEVQAVDRFSG